MLELSGEPASPAGGREALVSFAGITCWSVCQLVYGVTRYPHQCFHHFRRSRRWRILVWWIWYDWRRMRWAWRRVRGYGVIRCYRSRRGARYRWLPWRVRTRPACGENGTIARHARHAMTHEVLCLVRWRRGRNSSEEWLGHMRQAAGGRSCRKNRSFSGEMIHSKRRNMQVWKVHRFH